MQKSVAVNSYPGLQKDVNLRTSLEGLTDFEVWSYAKSIGDTYYYYHHDRIPNMRIEAQEYDTKRVHISGVATSVVISEDNQNRLLLMEPTIIAEDKSGVIIPTTPIVIADHLWVLENQLRTNNKSIDVSIGDLVEISAIISKYRGRVWNGDKHVTGLKYGISAVYIVNSGVPIIVDDHLETLTYDTFSSNVLHTTPQKILWYDLDNANVTMSYNEGFEKSELLKLMHQPIITHHRYDESGKLRIKLREDAVLNSYMMPTIRLDDKNNKLNILRTQRAELGQLTVTEVKRWEKYLYIIKNTDIKESDKKAALSEIRKNANRWASKISNTKHLEIAHLLMHNDPMVQKRAELCLVLTNEIYGHGKNVENVAKLFGINEQQVSLLYQRLKDATILGKVTEYITSNPLIV